MGLFSSVFGKMGHWHVRQIVKECSKVIIDASMHGHNQNDNPYLVDSALNLLIKHYDFSIIEEKKYLNLKGKFSDFISLYVARNLGREIDYISGEGATLDDEIKKSWPIFMTTKDGIQQKLKP